MRFLSGRPGDDGGDGFDDCGAFEPANLPAPGPFLEPGDVLTGREHAAFHRLTHSLFAERGVFDVTFGYNLARLNLDRRHPDAGLRYARDPDEGGVLRAEFTPTTEFCPQSEPLTVGAFRAWNGLAERHEWDLVRVRVAPEHHRAAAINGTLDQLAQRFRETGTVPEDVDVSEPADDVETGESLPF